MSLLGKQDNVQQQGWGPSTHLHVGRMSHGMILQCNLGGLPLCFHSTPLSSTVKRHFPLQPGFQSISPSSGHHGCQQGKAKL